jgi:hypothetical protein
MKITVELEKEDFDSMHDVIFEVRRIKPTNEEIQTIWDSLPDDIRGTALEWGCSDTVFRDKMYEWLKTISMTDQEIISRIIKLESEITGRIISDRTFRASDGDEYQSHREELKILRAQVKHLLNVPSYVKGGDTQRHNK